MNISTEGFIGLFLRICSSKQYFLELYPIGLREYSTQSLCILLSCLSHSAYHMQIILSTGLLQSSK